MEHYTSMSCGSHRRRAVPFLLSSAAFVAFLLVFFFPVVFQGKVIAPLDILDHLMRPWSDGTGGFGVHNAMVYDAISQYLPYDWAVCQSIKADGYIGWNPYVYGGYALLENTMLCPGDWHHLLYRFFDFWTAWDLGIVLQFALAGIGMIVMLRGEGLSASASLLGAVCFAFYSQHTIWIYHRWVLGASCWFPWMVWSIRRARRRNSNINPLSVAFTSLSLRGGSLQTCLFVALLLLCLFLDELVRRRRGDEKAPLGNFVTFYVVLILLSSVLFADVLANTLPAFLYGCQSRTIYGFLVCLRRLPHLITTLFPTAFGTPQTMDMGHALGVGVFNVRFAGAVAALLALTAFGRAKAPLAPRCMACLSLFVAFTPLTSWFYDRSTVVFGLGCAWLAAWSLDNLDSPMFRRRWRLLARAFFWMLGLWCIAGFASVFLDHPLTSVLQRQVARSLSPAKASRMDWLLSRSEIFVSSFPPWSAENLPMVLAAILGAVAVFHLSAGRRLGERRRFAWRAILLLCSFCELFIWSRTWITFSAKPDTRLAGTLYPVPDWAARLRGEMSGCGLLWVHDRSSDFDYLQLNAQSGIGISSSQGYETIKPKTLAPPRDQEAYDPASYAERGISHVLVLPEATPPAGLSAWQEVVNDADLHLFRNPAFDSRWHAVLSDGSAVALRDESDSPNWHRFNLPSGTIRVSLDEPFRKEWQTCLNGHSIYSSWKTNDGGTCVNLDNPSEAGVLLAREYRCGTRFQPLQVFAIVLLAAWSLSKWRSILSINSERMI